MADNDCLANGVVYGTYKAEYNWNAVTNKPVNAPTNWFTIGLIEGILTMNRQVAGETIQASQFGDTVLDSIYTGGQQFVSLIAKEWVTNNIRLMWPYGKDQGALGDIGRSNCDFAGVLKLTAVRGTKAAPISPATAGPGGSFVFRRAILSEDQNVQLNLGNVARDIPLTFRCFPYTVTEDLIDVNRWQEYYADEADIPDFPADV